MPWNHEIRILPLKIHKKTFGYCGNLLKKFGTLRPLSAPILLRIQTPNFFLNLFSSFVKLLQSSIVCNDFKNSGSQRSSKNKKLIKNNVKLWNYSVFPLYRLSHPFMFLIESSLKMIWTAEYVISKNFVTK